MRHRPVGPSETFTGPGDRAETRAVPITTEDHGAVLLRLDDGVRGVFHVSQVTAGRKNRLVARGRRDRRVDELGQRVAEPLWIGRRDAPNSLLERDPALLSPAARDVSHYPGGHAEGFPDTFKQLDLAVYGWIAAGGVRPPRFPTFADGDREVRLCEAIAQSATTRSMGGRHAMKLGFVSAILPEYTLEEVLALRRRAGVLERRADVLAAGQGRAALCGGDAPRRRRASTPIATSPRPARPAPAWRSRGWATIRTRCRPTAAESDVAVAHLHKVIDAAADAGRRGRELLRRPRPGAVGRRQLAAVPGGLAAPGPPRRGARACGSGSRTARCSSPPTSGPAARTWPPARRSGGGCSPTSPARASA